MIADTLKSIRIQKALRKTANAHIRKQADWMDSAANVINRGTDWIKNKALPAVARTIPGTPQNLDMVAQGAVGAYNAAKNADWKKIGNQAAKAGVEAAQFAANPAGYLGGKAGQGLQYVGGKIGDAVGSWWGNLQNGGKNAVIDQQLGVERRKARQLAQQRQQQAQQPSPKPQATNTQFTPSAPSRPHNNPYAKQHPMTPVQESANNAKAAIRKGNYTQAAADAGRVAPRAVGATVKTTTDNAADFVRNTGNRVAAVTNAKSWGEAGRNAANLVPGVVEDAGRAVRQVGSVGGNIVKSVGGNNAVANTVGNAANLPANVVGDVAEGVGGFYNAVTGQGAENQGKDFGDRMLGFADNMGNKFKRTFGLGLWQ